MPTIAVSARPADVVIASKQEWISRSLASILGPQGYVLRKTYNRAQALAQIRRAPPDAVIIDEQLPDGDGYVLCRELTEEGRISPSTPVFLALPRPPTRRDRLAALRAGAWACLGEPLDAEELLAALDVYVPAKLDADQARTQGLVDEVTGVYNVRGLTLRAQELAAQATRRHTALCCVLLAPDTEPAPGGGGGGDGRPNDTPLWLVRRIAAALRAAGRQSDAIGRLHAIANVPRAERHQLGRQRVEIGEPMHRGRQHHHQLALLVAHVAREHAAQARRLAERLATAILAEAESPFPAVHRFRLRAGFHGVPDFHIASIDSDELMLRATAALHKAQTESAGAWLRSFDEGDVLSD